MKDARMPALAELQDDQVWLLGSPVRIARISGKSSISFIDRGQPASKPVVTAEVAIVTQAIPDRISEEEARCGRIIVQSLVGGTSGPGKWTEMWAERAVHPVETVGNTKAAFLNDSKPMIPQTYVHGESGRAARTVRESPLNGGVVNGVLLEAVPEGIFEPFKAGLKQGDVNPIGDVANEDLPDNIMKLRSIATKRGVDISDISGAGAVLKIIERLKAAG